MPDEKPGLQEDAFQLTTQGKKVKDRAGKPVLDAETPDVAEDVADRLNEDADRRHEDNWNF